MKETHIHILTILVVALGLSFIAFLYLTEPRTLSEVASKGSVAIGTYETDKAEFANGLAAFRRDEFPAARAAFDRADPEKRDPETQFYIGYSYYREGWGRFSNDDALFSKGITTANRVLALNPNFRTDDESLQMKTAFELRTELEEGLKITPSDFNPLKLTRERK